MTRWTLSGWHAGSPGTGGIYVEGPTLEPGESVAVIAVAEHEAELQRVSEEYALQRVQLIASLSKCSCPVGWGKVVAEDCPRHNPKPRHTVSGASEEATE